MKKAKDIKQEIVFAMFAILYGMLAWNVCISFISSNSIYQSYIYFLAVLAPFCSIVYLMCTGKDEWTLQEILLQNLRFIRGLLPGALVLSVVRWVLDPRMIFVRNLLINYLWIFVMCLFYGAMFYAIYQATGHRTAYPVALLLVYTLNSLSPWLPILKNVGYKLYIIGKLAEENEFLIMLPYLVVILIIYGVAAVLQHGKKNI